MDLFTIHIWLDRVKKKNSTKMYIWIYNARDSLTSWHKIILDVYSIKINQLHLFYRFSNEENHQLIFQSEINLWNFFEESLNIDSAFRDLSIIHFHTGIHLTDLGLILVSHWKQFRHCFLWHLRKTPPGALYLVSAVIMCSLKGLKVIKLILPG